MAQQRAYLITGAITDAEGFRLEGALVRASGPGVAHREVPLGDAATDAEGVYRIEVVENSTDPHTHVSTVRIEVQVGDGVVGRSNPVRKQMPETLIDLQVDYRREQPADQRVHGTVRDQYGDLLSDVVVSACDRDLRHEEPLGRCPVVDGRYEVRYSAAQFRRQEKDSADLVLSVVDAAGDLLLRSPVHYNAPADYEVDLTLGGVAYAGPSEWEVQTGALMPLLGDLHPVDLRENEEHDDLSFLAGETGYSASAVGAWAASWRLSDRTVRDQTPVPPEAVFAFLRQGEPSIFRDPLEGDAHDPDRVTLHDDALLRDLSTLTPDRQRELIQAALDGNLVPARLSVEVEELLATLQKVRVRYAAESNLGGGKGTVGELLDVVSVPADARESVLATMAEHSGSLAELWKRLEADESVPTEVVGQVRVAVELGTLTRNHVPLVGALASQVSSGELTKRQLAQFSPEDWAGVFARPRPDGEPVGVPDNVDGDTPEERQATYISILDQQFERAYPTASLAAKISRLEPSAPQLTGRVARFLDEHPDLQLDRVRIDHYLADRQGDLATSRAMAANMDEATTVDEELVAELATVQRVFKLDPTYATVDTLLSRGIESAQQVYFMGEGQFVSALEESPVDRITARTIYRRSENVYALALATFTDYNQAVNGVSPAAVAQPAMDEAATARIATLPSLRTLFGSLDYCECRACRSVYSPAAHFVDVLRFLGDRGTQGTAAHAGKKVRDVLLERRPDLGDIELSCENTNTPLPYIDLVNEILEDVVAPPTVIALDATIIPDLVEGPVRSTVLDEFADKGVALAADAVVHAPDVHGRRTLRDSTHAYVVFPHDGALGLLSTRQSTRAAAELRSSPEHLNQAACTTLAGEVFPLHLPFDLPTEQARAYLDRLGVPQPRLLELFRKASADSSTETPSAGQVASARLGIGDVERQILTGVLPGRGPWEYWGLNETDNSVPDPDAPDDATRNVTGGWLEVLAKVPLLMHRAGLTYRELLQLLDARFVNPSGSLLVADTDGTATVSCDISTLEVAALDAAAAGRMHRFVRLWRRIGVPMWDLDRFLAGGDIDDDALGNLDALARLSSRTGLDWATLVTLLVGFDDHRYVDYRVGDGVPVPTVYEQLFRSANSDAADAFPARPADLTGTIGQRVPGLLAALRTTETDLDLVLVDQSLGRTDALDATTLSEIHRTTALARALGLAVQPFLRLVRISGATPFADARSAWDFACLVDELATSRLGVAELDYLLTHTYTPSSGVSLDDRTVVAFLSRLRTGVAEVAERVRQKGDETDQAYVGARLGLLPSLVADADQGLALAIVDGSWSGSAGDREDLVDRLLGAILDDLTAAHAALGALPSGDTQEQRQARLDARFAYVAPKLEAFLLRTQRALHVSQQTATLLELDEPSSSLLLAGLQVSGSTTPVAAALNDPDLHVTDSDGTYQFELDEASFPDVYKGLRLLHKAALVLRALQMRPAAVAWWLDGTHANDLGWLSATDLDVDGATALDLDGWLAMEWFFGWKAALPASDLSAFDLTDLLVDNTASSTDVVAALAQLTGWRAADLTSLAEAFGWLDTSVDVVRERLATAAGLRRVTSCMHAVARLGVTAARAASWASAVPDATIAEQTQQALKARYDLPQWLEANREVNDTLRERRRDALVSWLLAHPDAASGQHWVDVNGLYSHLLIDVEMSACALTSRLKQATAAAQLFVQRVHLDLERDIVASTVLDPKWKQWKWMRRYRVWEANRKVFLYPENWIEPELRGEKSPFFVDLEQDLQQNDVTGETVEVAYRAYLEKLDKVANLEIRAMFEQQIGDESVLHVVGRTRSSKGAEYFYRTRLNRARWTAWQPVNLEVNADHLMIGMHSRRLILMWPQLLEKAVEPTVIRTPVAASDVTLAGPSRYWEVRLYWSELKNGSWTPKVLADGALTVSHLDVGGMTENITFRTRAQPQIRAHLFTSPDPTTIAPVAKSSFEKLGPEVTPTDLSAHEHLVSPGESRFHGNLIRQTGSKQYFYYSSVAAWSSPGNVPAHHSAPAIEVLGKVEPNRTWTVLDSRALGFDDTGSFFTWDRERSYFVDYTHQTYTTYVSRGVQTWHLSSFRFYPHYHPFVDLFTKELNTWGLAGLLNRRIQLDPGSIPGGPAPFDFSTYQPSSNVPKPWPVEEVDFSYKGAYSPYNWELFFHAPMLIASRLSANQRFEEALEWFHYVFDPTGTDTSTADPGNPQQRFWVTKPFYETTKADYYRQKIESIMLAISKGDAELRTQVAEWRDHPFDPHLIARMRTVAYQKNVLLKYVQTLVAWGDQLFGQDTMESVNEATQLYVLAASVLGKRPRSVPSRVPNPARTFYQLQAEGVDAFGNVLRDVENLLPSVGAPASPTPAGPELPRLDVLYFGIPTNEKMTTLWDTVEDRLFKVRNCMNLAGVVRQLPLFEPPIDPGLLVKAAAAGLDVASVLSDTSAPMPSYRFTTTIQRAQEACAAVANLGAAMLAALEKRDAEAFAVLRSSHEAALLDIMRDVRAGQVDEARAGKETSRHSREVIELRKAYHERLVADGLNTGEVVSLALSGVSLALESAVAVGYIVSGGLKLVPNFLAGAAGFGGTPTVSATMGGQQIGNAAEMAVSTLRSIATAADKGASMAGVLAGHARREQEWRQQAAVAAAELPAADSQILAAEIRERVAEHELRHHDRQRDNHASEDEFMRSKFTNVELYDWMVSQLATVYLQSYQLAFDLAKRAERCFRYELGLSDSSYVRYGHWDSLRKGLLAGERLGHDLRRLDAAYHELNRREYELTKNVSLAQLDPVALLQLKRNGECFVDIPEVVFDLDHPGHYFRRLKTVSMSVPCVVPRHGTVACTLTLVGNSLRKDATLLSGKYPRDTTATDPRFRDATAAVQSIATSTATGDSGMFELRFDDPRYLPFEAAGAISSWHVRLNAEIPQFDPDTITDVVLHLKYTAREGGSGLRTEAVKDMRGKLTSMALASGRTGLYRVIDVRQELPDEFHRFLNRGTGQDQVLDLGNLGDRLPWFTSDLGTLEVRSVEIAALMEDTATYEVEVSPLGTADSDRLPLAPHPAYEGLHRAAKNLASGAEVGLGDWRLRIRRTGVTDFKSLPATAVEELFVIINYKVG